MIFQETKKHRRIVGRLERGDDCVDRLTEFFEEHDVRAAQVRAVGRLSSVEVVRFDAASGEYREVHAGDGTFDVLQLSGNVATLGDEIAVRLHALLAGDGAVRPQLVGGQLQSGTVIEFEFTADLFDDLELERQLDPDTGMLTLQSVRRRDDVEQQEPQTTDEIEGQSMSWDDAARADSEPEDLESADRESEPAATETDERGKPSESRESSPYEGLDLDDPVLESGDIIDHPKLGRCRVIKIEDDKYAHIRLPQGKIRKLSLNVVEIEYSGEENGRNVFEAQVS